MTTPAEQEAERRYPKTARMRFAFESGAAFEREQLRELLEAAREYRDADLDDSGGYAWESYWLTGKQATAVTRLLAAAAALEETA